MRNKITLGLGIIAFSTFAQDTLSIADFTLEYDDLASYSFNDTVSVRYEIEYTGSDEVINIKQRTNVINSEINNFVEDSVLVDTSLFIYDTSVRPQMRAQVKLVDTQFKNGNNTVVIWPEHSTGAITKDSVKMNVIIDDHNSVVYIGQVDQEFVITNNQLIFNNNSDEAQLIQIINMDGQKINGFKVASKETSTTYIPSGFFIISTISNTKKRSVKVLVR